MKKVHQLLTALLFAGALIGFNSCQKDNNLGTTLTETKTNRSQTVEQLIAQGATTDQIAACRSNDDDDDDDDKGVVFVMNNATTDNKILVYQRAQNGSLTAAGSVSTGGQGTGGGLGSQNALLRYGNYLYACNAGSNDFTVFRVHGTSLTMLQKVPAQGMRPISITVYGDLVYVLDAGGTGNIAGFRWQNTGHLTTLAGSVRPLSTNAAGPAQIQFNPYGRVLVVTEKATNTISTYNVGNNGIAAAGVAHASTGATPFGFAFTDYGRLIVSDAFGGTANQSALTSYNLANNGNLSLITGPVKTLQTAACWVVVSENNRFCYTTNTGSNNISGYKISSTGALTLLDANGITAATAVGPIDMILSQEGRYLYVLTGMGHSVDIFRVTNNGGLTSLGSVTGLPAGAVGIAAK